MTSVHKKIQTLAFLHCQRINHLPIKPDLNKVYQSIKSAFDVGTYSETDINEMIQEYLELRKQPE